MSTPSPKPPMDAATTWFYVLTFACVAVTCIAAGLGAHILDQLQPELTRPQVALGWGVVMLVVLQCGIGTLLVMLFYDPKRRSIATS